MEPPSYNEMSAKRGGRFERGRALLPLEEADARPSVPASGPLKRPRRVTQGLVALSRATAEAVARRISSSGHRRDPSLHVRDRLLRMTVSLAGAPFRRPGKYGQHWLNVKFENSMLRVPFRIRYATLEGPHGGLTRQGCDTRGG